jgi:hypothetical protein
MQEAVGSKPTLESLLTVLVAKSLVPVRFQKFCACADLGVRQLC